MKNNLHITGSILILSGCVLIHDVTPNEIFLYGIILNIIGIILIITSLFNIPAQAKALAKEMKDEIHRQNSCD